MPRMRRTDLIEGDESIGLVALFALNHFAHEETRELLEPFLHSPLRKERWASAMVLGGVKTTRNILPLCSPCSRVPCPNS